MRKVLLFSLILAFTASVNAQTSDKKWGIGAALGGYGTINNGGIGLMPEGYFLSRYLSPRFDLVFQGDLGLFRSNANNDVNLANGLLNLRLKLSDESQNFRPYIYGGPGVLSVNTGTSDLGEANKTIVNFDLGFGSKLYVSPATALYVEAGYIHGLETTIAGVTERESYWKTTIGIETAFGKTKDSDMDGVSDKKDKCPNTPDGVAVDKDGCPIDTDGDGVADYIDDCPTVAGLTSLKGCPDKDKDGIADKDDACPDVAGLASLKGCPDSDGDGITDNDDICPNTPKGYKVDASGCPFDTDKDGVIDEEDDCPTVAGPKDNKGCPVIEVVKSKEVTLDQVILQNISVDPVHFAFDKSKLTDYSKGKIEKLIETLNTDTEFHVNLFGYTDNLGPSEYNLKLAQKRIQSVMDYLISKGISEDRIIKQKALGESKPMASNNTAEGRKLNRRVEFEIYKMK
ncbi:MAG TPA: OmpA family protein [Prolixibacteraceae bacterium]|nr:OmpA family protein [Prolixibacteraceae bacterium]